MNTCNKMSYGSASEVRQDIKVITSRNDKGENKKLRPYLCTLCSNWHMTSASKKDSKKIGREKKEIKRRLDIVKKISIKNTVDKVLKLQEPWMTLILNDNKPRVVCVILNERRVISLAN